MTRRVEKLPQEKFDVYRNRAVGLLRTMESALTDHEYHGAALSAVHATMSAGDALTIFYLGERSRGQDHGELVTLVNMVPVDAAALQARRLASILARKTDAEYGSSSLSSRESESLVLQARRFVSWALGHLPSSSVVSK
jgi:hypothetical protein